MNKTPWYTRMTDDNWATAIKIAAVLVAMPRWIGALLEADGVPLMLTPDTAPWWGLFSAFASAGMALVEGVAFWYTLRAWRKYGGGWLFALIVASMATFAMVLTPYVMANVSGIKLASILQGGWIVAWSSCVSLSTILIVASVGYAQPKAQTDKPQEVSSQPQPVDTTGKQETQALLRPIVSVSEESEPAEASHNASQSRQEASTGEQEQKTDIDTFEEILADSGAKTSDKVLAFYGLHPDASQEAAAQAAGISRARVGQILLAAEKAGQVSRNGEVKLLAPIVS